MVSLKKFFNKSEMDLTTGDTKTLIKKFIIFTIPILLVGIFELLYNSFDLIVVQQKCGSMYGAAVGSNGSLIALVTQAFLGLSVGLNVVVARYVGKKDKEGASKATHTGILLALISGIIVAIIGFFCSKIFLKWMHVDESYIDIASNYLRIYFLSMPFLMLYNFGSSAFKGMGDSYKPLIFLVISGILNIGLNYLFVFLFDWKEVGVGVSTVICQALSAFLVMFSLHRNKGFIRFEFKELRIYKDELLEILRIGIPSGIEGVLFSISNVLLQASVNAWPEVVVTANTNSANISQYTYMAMYSVFNATPSFISANYGRGLKDNVKKCHIISLCMVTIVGIVMGYGTYFLGEPLLKVYMGENYDPEVTKYAMERMKVVCLTYFLCGLMDSETGVLRGVGYSFLPTIYTIFCNCIFRVIWDKFIYSPIEGNPMHSLGVLYMCYPISWIMAFAMSFITYLILRKKIRKKCDENLEEFNKKHQLNEEIIQNNEVLEEVSD